MVQPIRVPGASSARQELDGSPELSPMSRMALHAEYHFDGEGTSPDFQAFLDAAEVMNSIEVIEGVDPDAYGVFDNNWLRASDDE